MAVLKGFFKENKRLAGAVFLVWVLLCLAGGVYGSRLDGSDFSGAAQLIEASFGKMPSVKAMASESLKSHIRLFCIVVISSIGAFMSPVTFFTAGCKGFSSGFCASLILRIYSFRGIFINFLTIIIPLSLTLPIYLAVFTSALKFALSPRKNVLRASVSQRRKQWASYVLLQLCLIFCLFVASAVQMLFSCGVAFMINK